MAIAAFCPRRVRLLACLVAALTVTCCAPALAAEVEREPNDAPELGRGYPTRD